MAQQSEYDQCMDVKIKDRHDKIKSGEWERWEDPKMPPLLQPHWEGVRVKASQQVLRFAACKRCDKVLKLTDSLSGNTYVGSTMSNHSKKDHGIVFPTKPNKKRKRGKECGVTDYETHRLKAAKKLIKEGVTECIIEDGRPFRIADCKGFESMARYQILRSTYWRYRLLLHLLNGCLAYLGG
eukprot:1024857_1